MAQKVTVDPRFLAAAGPKHTTDLSGGTPSIPDATVSGNTAPKKETRKELLDRLAQEFEEASAKAKMDAANGEGCLMCSG